jgi:RNA polymerase sigma factor (sigma-70 family)
LSVAKVRRITEIRHTRAAYPISLDHPGPGVPDDIGPMVDLLEADLPDLDEKISVDQEVGALEDLMADLPTRTRHILEWRFGLEDDQGETLAEIGRRLGLSRERIRQIEKLALRDLHTRAARTQCHISRV